MLLFLLGCGPDVIAMYDREREAAMAVATDRPARWEPDLTLSVGAPDLARAAATAAGAGLVGKDGKPLTVEIPLPLGLTATFAPDVEFKTFHVTPSTACAACFGFDTEMKGRGTWELGPARGVVPVQAAATGTIEVAIRDGGRVEAKIRDVGSLDVTTKAFGELHVAPDAQVRTLLTQALTKAPAIRLAELDLGKLPIRDLRLHTTEQGVTVEILSDVAGATAVGAHDPPTAGVEVVVSPGVLGGLARRQAYAAGVQQMDIAADPRAIRVTDDTFQMDLRVWRLTGRGWYRDYRVDGKVSVSRGRLVLTATNAEQVGASAGAGIVDPLAALFQGKILDAVVDAVHAALPAKRTEKLGAVTLTAEAMTAKGVGGDLVVGGALTPQAPGK